MLKSQSSIVDFLRVRDIPYRIPVVFGEKDDCCSGKHVMLKCVFESFGYKCRYRVVGFRWSEMDLPQDILAVPHKNDSTHVFLEVMIGDQWMNVDATWDVGLSEVLPVNNWDGKSDTTIAVPVRKAFSVEESARIMADDFSEISFLEDIKKNGNFYEAFNSWLESVRK